MSNVISVNTLYDALQNFRTYVESNMPYKETSFFGLIEPSVDGFNANLGTMYIQTNIDNTLILNVFYKSGINDTDWTLFGSGSQGSSNAIKNIKFLEIGDYPTNIYNAAISDYLIVGYSPSVPFKIKLPVTDKIGSKVYLLFREGRYNYQTNYILECPATIPFYQTTESNIIMTNGGFYLECEYVEVSNNFYWYISLFNNSI